MSVRGRPARDRLAVGTVLGPEALELQFAQCRIEIAAVEPRQDLGLAADQLQSLGLIGPILIAGDEEGVEQR